MSKATKKKESAPKAKAAPKKDKDSRESFIAKAPIRRLMKNEGANLVAEKAVDLLIEKLTDLATKVTKNAIKMMKEDNRKRVTSSDVKMAERM